MHVFIGPSGCACAIYAGDTCKVDFRLSRGTAFPTRLHVRPANSDRFSPEGGFGPCLPTGCTVDSDQTADTQINLFLRWAFM